MSDEETPAAPLRITVPAEGLEFVTTEGAVILRILPRGQTGAVVEMPGADGGPNIRLDTDRGASAITVRSEHSEASAVIWAGQDRAVLSVNDAKGAAAARVASGEADLGGIISLARSSGETSAVLGTGPDGGVLKIFAADGMEAVGAVCTAEGGNVYACNTLGEPVSALGTDGGDGGLVVSDRNGAKIFAVPVWKHTERGRAGAQAEGAAEPPVALPGDEDI